jgi:hypothetical protein
VFSQAQSESKQWPYMLSYIAVNVPPSGEDLIYWTPAERVTWLIMNASTLGLVQVGVKMPSVANNTLTSFL